MDDDNDEYSLTPAKIMKLHRLMLVLSSDIRESVSPALWDLVGNKCCEWLRNEREAISKLSNSMTSYLAGVGGGGNDVYSVTPTKLADDMEVAQSSIECVDDTVDENADGTLRSHMEAAQATIAVGYCVFYMLSNDLGSASLFSREVIEDIIQFPKQFLTACHFLNTGVTSVTASTSTSSSSSNNNKASKKQKSSEDRKSVV